jgi:hypothetical protein
MLTAIMYSYNRKDQQNISCGGFITTVRRKGKDIIGASDSCAATGVRKSAHVATELHASVLI